jgi:hypothetical protein
MYELNIGPMTKNIVDGLIAFSKRTSTKVCLIASRRQVDYNGGYVNRWNTESFARYVKEKNPNVPICRDHGGIGQGRYDDDGLESLKEDAKYMNFIHIDPWKKLDLENAIEYTTKAIEICSSIRNESYFEVGTEESIYSMSPDVLDYVLKSLKARIPHKFREVYYAVIQSGTSLKNGINTGQYDESRLEKMVEVCKKHGVFSKEHNGDYLSPAQIKAKFSLGLDSINIAPEVAHIETEIILERMNNDEKNMWFDICIRDGQWAKWFSKDFNPIENRDKVLKLCGHYVLSQSDFGRIFDLDSISSDVEVALQNFILARVTSYGH